MWDARLLTLYKQHYMDCYDGKLCSDYSCWGYYDGLDIAKVESIQYSSLLIDNMSAPISDLWYKSGEKIGGITGQYGSINIGMFRYEKDKSMRTETFWVQKEKMPFFGVSFLQLNDPMQYMPLGRKIEEGVSSDSDKMCDVITYCTYDNADMILLIIGNSLNQIEKELQKIDSMPEIRYQHSVLGVSEQYLSDCKTNKVILNFWHGIKCFLDEPVSRLDVRLVSSGEPQIAAIEKEILDDINKDYTIKNYDKATYSYVSGHENMILSLPDTDVKSMLTFLLPDGFATHQNKSYAKRIDDDNNQCQPRLFNIETSYILNSNLFSNVDNKGRNNICSLVNVSHNWFQEKISEYKEKLQDALQNGDESLYSYYLALLRTLNVLVQYERFSLSEDIFYLLYPSFKMFDEKLNHALDQIADIRDRGEYYPSLCTIKQSMCEFLECVNSVIYHTIHTDQVYLMVPGYSGTSFSIPIKLNMLFLWFTDCVARLLGISGRKYRCILIPTMEATPITHWLKLEKNPESFLVCAKISQRSLYMPQSFMIILAHEMGHYIGGSVRCRDIRAEKMIDFVTKRLTHLIFTNGSENSVFCSSMATSFEETAKNTMISFMKNIEGKGYYGDDVEETLKSACRHLLAQCRTINSHNLIKVYSDLNQSEKEDFYQINKLLDSAEDNAADMLIHNTMCAEIEEEMKVYREVFSDLVAIWLLECDKSAFDEAYRVSEGMDVRGEEIERRDKVMVELGLVGWSCDDKPELTEYDRLLCDYAKSCNGWLDDKLHALKSELVQVLKEIRQLYQLFVGKTMQENPPDECNIYDKILSCIQIMKKDIDKEIHCVQHKV